MRKRALGAALVLATSVAQAQSPETLGWLRKMHQATQQPLLHRHVRLPERRTAPRLRALRATRPSDIEKLEVLDGVPREIVRTRDKVRCYLPDSRVVKVDRARPTATSRRCCPSSIAALARHYDISLGETRRIAGFDCQAVVLTPKDNLRYGYRLYADVASGMLLRAVTVDAAGEQHRAVHVHPAHASATSRPTWCKPRHAGKTAGASRMPRPSPAQLAGWGLATELPGFHKVIELKRRLGESRPVGQMVLLRRPRCGVGVHRAAREPAAIGRRTGLASMGAINIYTREVANHMVTVVGRGAGGERAAHRRRGRVPPPDAVEQATDRAQENPCSNWQ